MEQNASEILRNAMKLPLEARAAIAGFLLDSLDGPIDLDIENAWKSEILSRIQEIDEGKVQLISWADARRKIVGH